MEELREQSLLVSITDFIKTINSTIDEQGDIEQGQIEEILSQTIYRDRDYMISVLQSDIERTQNEIKQNIKRKNRLARNYAITVNQISLINQEIRRKIKERSQLLITKDDLKEKKKRIQNLYDQIYFLYSQFQNTILDIKNKKSEIKNEIQSIRAEFASISSNNLVTLRHSNFNIKSSYENFLKNCIYQKETIFINEREKLKKRINKYKNKNAEFDDCFREIIDMLGKYALDPKSLLLDLRKKTFEEQIAQDINDDYSDVKLIAKMLKEKCDLIFSNKDNEINGKLKKMEIKESHTKEKLRLTILNCGIQNAEQSNSPSFTTRYSPRYSKLYSPRYSPKRDPVDILINHKSLKFASWEESSKLLNQTFEEIEQLRKSRLNLNSEFNSNDSIE